MLLANLPNQDEQKSHIFFQKLTGIGPHIKDHQVAQLKLSSREYVCTEKSIYAQFLHTNVHKSSLVLKSEYRVYKIKT